jgi:uncharacterized protein DUF4174
MFKVLAVLAAVASSLALPAAAQEGAPEPELVITEAGDQVLDDFLWRARVLVIFADSENDPRFVQQMGYITARPQELAMRDVIVITDTDPAALLPIRKTLRPRGFDLVLIGKDGFKYLRKPLPWDVREITRSIDKMPLRQQELRDQRAAE